jgi:hypothetical protein
MAARWQQQHGSSNDSEIKNHEAAVLRHTEELKVKCQLLLS